jgi:hypothetical protein
MAANAATTLIAAARRHTRMAHQDNQDNSEQELGTIADINSTPA